MRAAIIGASEESLHTINKAHELGVEIVALDGNPDAAGLKAADIPLVVDISDVNATIEAIRNQHVDFTLTVPIGRYLTTIGAVNDALGLPGISEDMAKKCTDKYLFHQTLSDNNLRNCHCYLVSDSSSRSADDYEINYPAILKPRYGSGSRGIHFVTVPSELNSALKLTEGEDYILEECVDGDEYGVDGAVIDGTFHLVLLRKKDNTLLPARQAVAYYSVSTDDPFYKDVYDYMHSIVNVIGLDECLLHGDIIRTEEGPFAIEISARPSGHSLHNLFTPLCTGVDMASEYIKHRIGLPASFNPTETKNLMIHYFNYEGIVKNLPSVNDVSNILSRYNLRLIRWNCKLTKGSHLDYVDNGHSLMQRGFFIIESDSNQYNIEIIQIIGDMILT